jgi:hypothetical protein
LKIRKKYWVVYLLTGFIISSVLSGLSFANEVKTVLIISIDALHPKAINPKTSVNIQQLLEQGVYTLDGLSTNPPLTLLSHAAMFSGIGPEKGSRTDNTWQSGQPGIKERTIFNDAKTKGFSTGFFYSKEKLGYLVNQAVDQHKLDSDFSVDNYVEISADDGIMESDPMQAVASMVCTNDIP